MTLESFKDSLRATEPPGTLSAPLRALWWDAKGDWHRAHTCAQEDSSEAGAWVHAYLHRKEGDLSNAAYWYRKAGRAPATDPLDAEWQAIAAALLPDR